jgi:hypothetical protein
MGRLTEYYKFLKVPPRQLAEFSQTLHHVTVTDEMKKQRRRLKWYKK